MTAANIALTKSKPVVDKIGPTVNSYANKGLDTLEDKVPIITKQPEEVMTKTKTYSLCYETVQVERENALEYLIF